MRSDMKKVVTERPRVGGGLQYRKGTKRADNKIPLDEKPKREKIRQKWIQGHADGKEFTDVLGPLYRYLVKQIGRPWNKVYSEISKNLPKTSVQNLHIYTHIWQFVEKDVEMIEKKPYYKAKKYFYGEGQKIPIESFDTRQYPVQMYINPTTGLLCKAPKRKNKVYDNPKIGQVPGVRLYPGVQLHKINGIWHEVKVAPWKEVFELTITDISMSLRDEILDRYYKSAEQLISVYGGRLIGISKRRLTKKEIRFNCLE